MSRDHAPEDKPGHRPGGSSSTAEASPLKHPRPCDIVCLAGTTWDGLYLKSTVELMKEFARRSGGRAAGHRVLFVDHPGTIKSLVHDHDGHLHVPVTPLRRLGGFMETRPVPGGEIHLLHPPAMIPHNRLRPGPARRMVMRANRAAYARAVKRSVEHLGLRRIILVNAWEPLFGAGLVGGLGEILSVYYCYDEMSAAPWKARHAALAEEELLRKVDLLIATSPRLLETRRIHNPRAHMVPNGVDFHLFNRATHPGQALHPWLRDIPSPVVGYHGTVDQRVDAGLLEYLARKEPGWSFVLVGPERLDRADRASLKALPNVHLFGPLPGTELPGVLKAFDAGIIPFRHTDFTAAIYPLKVNEYLAAGRPVVMTDFAPLDDVGDLVAVASDGAGFHRALALALKDPASMAHARIRQARRASWRNRAELFADFLDQALRERGAV